MDQPTAARLQHLKQRGMLEDTLVISAGEFGRTATGEGKPERLGLGHQRLTYRYAVAICA